MAGRLQFRWISAPSEEITAMNLPLLVSIVSRTLVAVLLALVAAAGPSLAQQPQGDAEILALLIAVNENEVGAATVAEQKAATTEQPKMSQPVLDFAKMLHEQHAKGAQDTKELATKIGIKPADTPAVAEARTKGKQLKDKLTALKGQEFEKTFVADMATGHREVLQKVDSWMKTAQNAQLKQHLTSTRERVAMHLKEAERLQASRS
jgi:putative membrane protein